MFNRGRKTLSLWLNDETFYGFSIKILSTATQTRKKRSHRCIIKKELEIHIESEGRERSAWQRSTVESLQGKFESIIQAANLLKLFFSHSLMKF